MNIGFIGNIPPPVGGAEVLLAQLLNEFVGRAQGCRGRFGACLKHREDAYRKDHGHVADKYVCTLVRWRRQIFTYFPERMVRVYAPKGTMKKQGGLSVHYLFEALERRPHELRRVYQDRMISCYIEQGMRAAGIFQRAGAELIHAHMLFPNLLFAGSAAEALSVPLVLTVHGMLEFRLLDHFRRRYPIMAGLVEGFMSRADAVVAVSDEIIRECRRRGAKRIVKISGGIDRAWFRSPRARRKRRDIVFVGSVRQDKGAALLIRAFERMASCVDANLIFIGRRLLKGPAYVRARANRRIQFLGLLRQSSVRRILGHAKMVVLPSMSEGMPMSILEAMACGIPVLATQTGDLARHIKDGHNGFLIRERRPASLAAQMLKVARRNDLADIGERARKTARRFEIGIVARQYEQLYRALAR